MRKILLLTVVLFAFSSMRTYAQQNAIKLNLWSIAAMTGSVFYERTISDNKSINFGVAYTSVGYSVNSIKYKLSGFSVTPEFRFYLSSSKDAPAGFYLGPFLRYRSLTTENSATVAKGTFTFIGGGAVVGHQWLFGERVTLDLFVGPLYNSVSFKLKSGNATEIDDKYAGGGMWVRSGMTLGVAF